MISMFCCSLFGNPRFKRLPCAVALAAMALCAAPSAALEVSCAICHDDKQAEFESSAHALAGLSCPDCHGGNPAASDEKAHETGDFRRAANKREIAESCAACHSDVRRMNPYGLPTDQLDRYKTSKHGERLFEHGDQKVAACVDCHGSHDIMKVKSPNSHVHPANIPGTCGRCHADAKLMSQYNLPSDAVEKYKSSYHAFLLLEKGDLSAPTCVTCHGNHGAVPPGAREVGQVCGKCHVRQRELFERSPHAGLVEKREFAECVACHENHAVRKASVELFDSSCVRCHAEDAKPLALRDEIAALIREANASLKVAEDLVRDATSRGLATEDDELSLRDAKTAATQLEALQHALSAETLRPTAARVKSGAGEIAKDIERLERIEQWKRRALVPIWIFLGAMAAIFWAKRRQLERQR